MMGVVVMATLAVLLTVTLLLIAGLHALWGLGASWPASTETDLARAVVGSPGISRMPSPAACFAVAVLLVAIACWPLWRMGWIGSPLPASLSFAAGIGIAAVFGVRGVATYISAFRTLAPEMPFAAYDRLYYAPLCLALAAGFAVLLLSSDPR
jgi:hypothetical protein